MIYPRLSARFDMLVFFTNVSLMVFRVRYLTLFCFLSVIEGPEWFWMGSLHKNIPLMMEFLKAPFLVLHFFYYTLMTFLMLLFVILLSMLMIPLSSLGAIRRLICGKKLVLASELKADLQDTGDRDRKWLVDFIVEKLDWFCLTGIITLVLLV